VILIKIKGQKKCISKLENLKSKKIFKEIKIELLLIIFIHSINKILLMSNFVL